MVHKYDFCVVVFAFFMYLYTDEDCVYEKGNHFFKSLPPPLHDYTCMNWMKINLFFLTDIRFLVKRKFRGKISSFSVLKPMYNFQEECY